MHRTVNSAYEGALPSTRETYFNILILNLFMSCQYYLIYKITNKINNKIYIGAHKTNDKNDDYFGSSIHIKTAIKQYGIENFEKEILFECNDEKEMWQKEAEIVNEKFLSRDDVYNVKCGGHGGFDFINKYKKNIYENHNKTENFRRSVSSGVIKWWENRTPEELEAYSQKVSEQFKEYYKNNDHPFLGRKHSEQSKEKMRESKVGKVNGKDNPAYGTMWITNGTENQKIKKDSSIPDGWKKGRVIK